MSYIKNFLGDIRNYFDQKKYESKKKNAKNSSAAAKGIPGDIRGSGANFDSGGGNCSSEVAQKKFIKEQPKQLLQEKYGHRRNAISDMIAKKPTSRQNEKAGNIIKKKLHPENKSFKKMARNRQSDLVYLVRGKDQGRDAWHYVLVDRPMLAVFLQKTKGGSLDVADYGKVLYSGWGQDPPKEIVAKVNEDFGIKGDDDEGTEAGD